MKALYYGFWNLFLLLPDAVRILVGVLLLAFCFDRMWFVQKYICAGLIQICKGINYCVMGGARYILPNIFRRSGNECDEKIRKIGKHNSLLLKKKYKKIMHSRKNLLTHSKHIWKVLGFVWIWALLPFFSLEKYLPHDTLTKMYGLHVFLVNVENRLIQGIEDYPPFWIEDNTREAVAETESETEPETGSEESAENTPQPIYLKLNNATYHAHVREAADIKSNSIHVVSKEDILIYEHIYEYDSKKFWLKVTLPDYGLEGWISERVIDSEIVDTLDLQHP